MEAAGVGASTASYRLGPRVPLTAQDIFQPTRILGRDLASQVIARSSSATTSKCVVGTNENLCEKPAASDSIVLPVVLGVVIPLVGLAAALIYLHRRSVARMRSEDINDPHKSLDFGLTIDTTHAAGGRPKRKSMFGMNEKDMASAKHRQLSMDMNLSSPYLLPPEVHNSRESLESMARTLHNNEDPYGPVSHYATSDAASMRSFNKETRDGASIYNVRAKSPLSPYPESITMPSPPPAVQQRASMPRSIVPTIESADLGSPFSVNEVRGQAMGSAAAELEAPPPVMGARKGLPSNPRPAGPHSGMHGSISEAGTEEPFVYDTPGPAGGMRRKDSDTYPAQLQSNPIGELPGQDGAAAPSFPSGSSLPSNGDHPDGPAVSVVAPIVEEPQDYDGNHFPESEERGRALHRRQSSEYPPEQDGGNAGLAAPLSDTKRMSVGFRPLPPDAVMETEDPETRANRIRSFYKEYFDDGKPDMAEYNQHYPPNGIPAEYRGANGRAGGGGGGAQYYEDYDASFRGGNGNAPYFDPETNAFVMPYAQPVARRAMTPPPSGSRFPGGGRMRGPSVGSSMRPGSSASGRPGPRPGSSMSSAMGGPRSASNMGSRAGPRKPIPPPTDLITLPTPSKLKDDSFALLGAIEFAPPSTYKDHVAGRPESPLGMERRPYELKVPVSSPLVSSFEEMAVLPSPHLLRKSSTFTGLDFAPPRKIRDVDTMSDAGSIRSNRSGISAAQQQAIRSGAGRVSRLPTDTVFTQAALADTLKPNWDLRH